MQSNGTGLKLVTPEPTSAGSSREPVGVANEADYQILSAWRDTLRHFMTASKAILKQAGITPHQYQALLAIRFGAEQQKLAVGELAKNLHVRHNSAVTLINKLAERGLVRRVTSHRDRRVVYLHLTAKGETILRKLVTAHRRELDLVTPNLRKILI
ncbi:MAG TPA: MarR family transcriptional regulator [Gammaproteobacteria bacterium]